MIAKRAIFMTGCVLLAALVSGPAEARMPEDGFAAVKTIDTRHFSLQLGAGVSEAALIQTLDISPQHKVLAGQNLQGATYAPDNLGDLLDALFSWAGNILDMNLYSYKGSIKVVRTPEALSEIYRKLYGAEDHAEKSFYIFELNTIYATQDDFTKEIIGHEMAHGIVCNFFVVPPPAKVQEVLAGYIEYQLRKATPRI